MTFPQTVLPILVELFYDGTWNTVTSDVQTRNDGILISNRGRANEQSSVAPAECELSFNNGRSKVNPAVTGRYSRQNPNSDLYGKIGHNTPVRVRVPSARALLLDGASDASTPDAAALDITGDLDLRAEFTLEQFSGTQCLISKGPFNGPQLSYQLLVGFTGTTPHLTFRWSADGSTTLTVDQDVPIEKGARIAVRVTIDVNNGAGGRTTTFYTAPSIDGEWTQVGQNVTAGVTSIFSGTSLVYVGRQGNTDRFTGSVYAARILNSSGVEVANPDFDAQPVGTTSFSDTAGRTWTLSAAASIGLGQAPRFLGEVSSWPVEWDQSGNDVWVPIKAADPKRRIGQGSQASTSGVRTYLASTDPDVYMPLDLSPDDVSLDVSNRVSVFPGTGDLGSELLPGLRVNTTAPGYLFKYVYQPASPTVFTLDYVFKAQQLGALDFTLWCEQAGIYDLFKLQLRGDGVNNDAQIVITDDYYNVGGISSVNSGVLDAITDGDLHHVRFELEQNGANVDVTAYIDGVQVLTTSHAAYTLKRTLLFTLDYAPTTTNYVALGHIVVWFGTAPAVADVAESVLFSLTGEAAGRRMERLADEAGIPLTFIGDPDDTALLGPQAITPAMDLIEAAAVVDLGILYAPRDALTLTYRTRRNLYGQAAGLTLDYSTGVFAEPPAPTDDDALLRNRFTVTRDGGGSLTAEVATGPLSTQDPPNGVGVYDDGISLNLATDGQLADQAAWRLHLGTIDEPRYSTLVLNLHGSVFAGSLDLTAAAAALDVGDRLVITDMPAWLPPDDVSLLAQGFKEQLTNKTWTITVNSVPESPYDVAVYGASAGSGPDRYDTAHSELNTGVSAGATTLLVDSDDTLWTTNAAEFPFDIWCEGERITVTDIDGGQPAFVGVGTSATGNNASVTPGLPAGIAAGDLVLILASIRNSGTGVPNTPASWTGLAGAANFRLFGRIYDGVWTMPTVTFAGGVANADTIGQSCALRGVTLTGALGAGSVVNGSAQNILLIHSELNPAGRWGAAVFMGWKQDDWTSVAPLAGYTEIGEQVSTAGDDAGQVWDLFVTRQQNVEVSPGTDEFIVTGGAAAISRPLVAFLPRAPQTFTVTRAVNGISKAHDAGAELRLWNTPRYGL